MGRNLWGGPRATSISPAQCRAGREKLDWTVDLLGKMTGLSTSDILLFESGETTAIKDREPIISAFAEGDVFVS